MRIAIWDAPPAEFFVSGLTSGAVHGPDEIQIERADPRTCAALLREGRVDVAMVETLTVIRDLSEYDLLAEAALSSWNYPFARLVLRNGLDGAAHAVAFDPVHIQDVLLARIVLREHYGREPAFVPYPTPGLETLLKAKEDVSLIVGEEAAMLSAEGLVLDLGQEWYELVNYPMVWGLFAARKRMGTPAIVERLRVIAQAAEEHRSVWVQAREMPPDVHQFYSDDLRVRLDDLAMASLTELMHYMFYYNVIDEVPDLAFVELPEKTKKPERSDEGDEGDYTE